MKKKCPKSKEDNAMSKSAGLAASGTASRLVKVLMKERKTRKRWDDVSL